MTGMHSVSDIFCRRCKTMVGWTYAKAYESSQKYKEGKFIIEKINLHVEESDYYEVRHPAGERGDRWRKRALSWGSEGSLLSDPLSPGGDIISEYQVMGLPLCPRYLLSPLSVTSSGRAMIPPRYTRENSPFSSGPPQAPAL